jgi:hypothetical protein
MYRVANGVTTKISVNRNSGNEENLIGDKTGCIKMWLNNDFQKPASSQAIASLQIIIDMLNKDLKNALSEIKKN